MSKLLYIKASPRGERSFSSRVAESFLEAYRQSHPGDAVETLDLFDAELAEFDAAAAEGKYAVMSGIEIPESSRRAWERVVRVIDHFKSFDKYLLAVPMWNFGMPYRLKLYFDTVIQPGYTFEVTEEGYRGLIVGSRALTVYSSGGQYEGEYAGLDHQKPHVEQLLGFVGIEDRCRIVVDGTIAEGAEERLESAMKQARELAAEF